VSNSSFIPASSEATPSALYAERATLPELPPEPSLWESFRIQLRVIGALLIRESLTRYGRRNIGFLWLFAEPMLFTLGVTALWTIAGLHKGEDITITEFVLVGYSTILLWRNMPNRCVMALPPNYELLFHRQVKPIDVYLSRCILEATGATISFFVLTVVFHGLAMVRAPYDVLQVAGGWLLLMWYAFSISLFVGALSERTEFVERVWHIVQYLMIPLSGSFFMLQTFSPGARDLLLWLPSVSCAELIRGGYFGPAITAYYDVGYVVVFNSVVLLLALIQIRVVSRTLTPA
jgi:capsular polysaccharide transport system permease protein